ncbi:hypothetical protein CKO31_18835 [Thiohalocapsa halophila]|uniref:Chromosome partition protein Smc n=1 Tax=Thiohalocapsa halophila TaxID=69359 RepID=A0ABS1CLG1_9GAMM|nr:hypothetical protein [Thiohalocapsa halophila]MBK1632764.1 hypothetical protein [Thiohalocapsa halophila]
MGDLIIELALALLAATLIGWLIGRVLCKSGEYDERAARRRLETTLAERDKTRAMLQDTADGLRTQLGEQTRAAAGAEQEQARLRGRLTAVETEAKDLLDRIEALDVCNARRHALEAELDDQQALVLELRATCDTQAQQIRALTGELDGARTELAAGHTEQQHKDAEISAGRRRHAEHEALIATLEQEKSDLEQALRRLGPEHDSCLARLQALAAAVEALHQRIRERAAPRGRRRPDSRAASGAEGRP